jgi:hypothetical protein
MQRLGHLLKAPIGSRSFCAIMLVLGLLLFALPMPEVKNVKLLGRAMKAPDEIALVGPSVIDTVSRCDKDSRTIPDLVAADTHMRVSDLSDPGQPISDEINLAAVAARNHAVTDVVLPIAPAAIDEWTTPSYRKLLTYKMISPRFAVFHAASLADFWSGLSLSPQRAQRAFSFDGRAYPDYRVVSATEFATEKKFTSCPELTTHDPAFTKSYYWWMYVAGRPNPALYQLVGDLGSYLEHQGHRLHVVLLPLNRDLLRSLSPAWASAAIARQREVAAALTARHVHVVDLSTALASDQFITPWCACTHLSDQGRGVVAQAIAADIRSSRTPQMLASVTQAKIHGL